MTTYGLLFKGPEVNALAHPKLWIGLCTLVETIYEVSGEKAIVTSMWDQEHADDSLHYCGCAADVRSHTLNEDQKDLVLRRVRTALSTEYDIIIEFRGGSNEHFHLEWDKGKYDRRGALRAVVT